MTQGWIKLHRRVRDHWLWQIPERLRAWIDLIFLANYEDREEEAGGEVFNVPQGSFFTRERDLAERWGRSQHWTRDFLSLLQQAEMITRVGSKNGSTITILKYKAYQDISASREQEREQGGSKVGAPYKEEVIEEDPYLLPEVKPSEEAEEFFETCRAVYEVRVEVRGQDFAIPPDPKLRGTFDKFAKVKWPQVKDWKEVIAAFGTYWRTPATQQKPKTFDYWRRFRNWCSKEVSGEKPRRPSGQLEPGGGEQRLLDEFEKA